MSKGSYPDANAPPAYDSQMAPGQGGIYPPLGFQAPPQQAAPYNPPPGVQYNAQPSPQVVHAQQPIVITPYLNVGPDPVRIKCTSCQANIKTDVSYNNTAKTHLIALVLCLIGCWPCVCLPYCMASCRDTVHTCPECKTFLGTYRAT